MDRIKLLMRLIIISSVCTVVTSCSLFLKPSDQIQPPMPFEDAISTLANSLLDQVKADRASSAGEGEINVMIIPFADADSYEVPEISRSIEKIIIEEGTRNFPGFNLTRLTSKNIGQADYIMNGTIQLDFFSSKDTTTSQKYYHVSSEVRKLADSTVIAKSNVWISDMNLDYTPTAIYRDSPLYLKGSRPEHRKRLETTQRQTDREGFFDISLETRAMLIEGRMAYENADYETAEALFSRTADRKDGQDLGTYAGLYLANYKLGRFQEAEKAFAKIVSISVEKYRYLAVKYLFGVDSVEFLKDENLKERYNTWIRNIGKYIRKTNYCLRIVGHASRTGTKAYNDQLSLERAISIQKRLQKTFPEVDQRSEVVGKGFSENIVGIGTDDERDALDRRVELFITDCN